METAPKSQSPGEDFPAPIAAPPFRSARGTVSRRPGGAEELSESSAELSATVCGMDCGDTFQEDRAVFSAALEWRPGWWSGRTERDGDCGVTAVPVESVPDRESVRSTMRSLPGWLVSFLLHTAALVSLALWTHSVSTGSAISLSAAMVGESALEELDVRLDEVSRADSSSSARDMESLEVVSTQPLALMATETGAAALTDTELRMMDGDSVWGQSAGDGEIFDLPDLGDGIAVDADGEGERARFFGVSARGKKFVFIVDCSGSMGGPRWIAARNELIRSLRQLNPDQLFSVMLYSSQAWSADGNLSEAAYSAATPENLDLVTAWLNRQIPGGGTLPLPAVRESLKLLPDAVFLLSDGELQDDSRGFLRRYNGRLNGRKDEKSMIPVNTIAIGMSAGAELLAAIAKENSGQFQHVW